MPVLSTVVTHMYAFLIPLCLNLLSLCYLIYNRYIDTFRSTAVSCDGCLYALGARPGEKGRLPVLYLAVDIFTDRRFELDNSTDEEDKREELQSLMEMVALKTTGVRSGFDSRKNSPLLNLHPDQVIASLLMASKWMQYGWKFEEGSLAMSAIDELTVDFKAARCYIKFADGFVQMPPMPGVSDTREILCDTTGFADRIQYAVAYGFAMEKWLRPMSRPPYTTGEAELLDYGMDRFVASWNGLLNRSLSYAEDGAAIFGNLLTQLHRWQTLEFESLWRCTEIKTLSQGLHRFCRIWVPLQRAIHLWCCIDILSDRLESYHLGRLRAEER